MIWHGVDSTTGGGQGVQTSKRTRDGFENVPQVWGAVASTSVLQGHPPLLLADGVPGDGQWMGSRDWALCLVHRMEDGSSYSGRVLLVLYPEV